jgi:hypothetical protein
MSNAYIKNIVMLINKNIILKIMEYAPTSHNRTVRQPY